MLDKGGGWGWHRTLPPACRLPSPHREAEVKEATTPPRREATALLAAAERRRGSLRWVGAQGWVGEGWV